jgi:glycosyltransferase involved in cell wall biosynthesis
MPPPRLSILVPSYNRRALVVGAVRSALAQTLSDIEVIVIDDGSTDRTASALAVAFDDPRLRIVQQQNSGTACARNRGLDEARAPLVAFLDSDDTYRPAFAARHVATLDAHPEAAISFSDVAYVGADDRNWTTVAARRRPPRDLQDMLEGAWWLPVGMVVRTDVARRLRFARGSYIEDTDFLWRLFEAGHRSVALPDVLADYLAAPEGVGAPRKSTAGRRQQEEMLRLQERHADKARDPEAHRVRMARKWARHLVRDGRGVEARAHARIWWRARPWSPHALRYLLRSLTARPAARGADPDTQSAK